MNRSVRPAALLLGLLPLCFLSYASGACTVAVAATCDQFKTLFGSGGSDENVTIITKASSVPNKCYVYVNYHLSYPHAKQTCEDNGGRLAWLEDAEMGALKGLGAEDSGVWVGLNNDSTATADWAWRCPAGKGADLPYDNSASTVKWYRDPQDPPCPIEDDMSRYVGIVHSKGTICNTFGATLYPFLCEADTQLPKSVTPLDPTGSQNGTNPVSPNTYKAKNGSGMGVEPSGPGKGNGDVNMCAKLNSSLCMALLCGWVVAFLLCVCFNIFCCVHISARMKFVQLNVEAKEKDAQLLDQLKLAHNRSLESRKLPPQPQ